jgi:PAS domain S-box-containing protein
LYKAVGSCLDAGTPYELELELVRPGGERRSTVARGEARRDAEGKVDFLFGTLQDVSDLKRARDLERQASERAQLATRAAGMGVWEWDIAGDRVTWDATMGQLWGGEGAASERSLDDWFDLVLPADREVMRQSFGNALAGERELQWILRRPDANDRIRHLRASGTLRLDAIGFPSRVLGVSWDVTAQHEAQAATRASEGLLKEFVRYVPAAIAMFDQDMRYLQASERWAHFFGQPIEGLIGASHYALFADTPQHWRDMHRRVLAGEALHSDEDPVADGEGNTRWYEWDAHPWHQPNGSVGGVIWYTKDITNKKLLELELVERRNALERSQADRERAVRELERSNVELQQFAYVASHDLQEPLRAVAGCAQLLKDSCAGRLDPKADELIAHIVDGAERMRALIRDLLALSRVGAQSLGLTEVDCDEACQIALANLEAARRTSDAVVRVDPLPSAPGEARQIVQLFQNLIGNALKYRSAERPAIHVGCNVADDEHIYFVADNGIGIEPQYFDRIFGVFQRLHTRTAYEGTGIGLAICSKVVQRHDGRIWVESQPGKGSTFRFALPRQPKEVAP